MQINKLIDTISIKSPDKHIYWHLIFIILVTLTVYYNSVFNGFVYDDKIIVLNNPWIQSLDHVIDIFNLPATSFRDKTLAANYYRPLTYIFHIGAYSISQSNPYSYHLLNIFISIMSSIVVYMIVRYIDFEFLKSDASSISIPFITTILFTTHPIHTEAVDFVSSISELSFAFFLLLSFYFYIASNKICSTRFMLSVACYFASTLCKETGLTLIAIIFLYDMAFNRDKLVKYTWLSRYVFFLLVILVYFSMRYNALGAFVPNKRYAGLSLYQQVINVFPLFYQYLCKLIFPTNLSIIYTFHPIIDIFDLNTITSIVITVTYIALLCIAFVRHKTAFISLVFISVPLLPALYISGVGESPFADRYLYLPSFGFSLLLAIFANWLSSKSERNRYAITAVLVIIVSIYSFGTIKRNYIWHDDYSLWADAASKAPNHHRPYAALGEYFVSKWQLDKAIELYKKALSINPYDLPSLNGMATALSYKADYGEAEKVLLKSIDIAPNNSTQYYNLGLVYAKSKRYNKSIEAFKKSLNINPNNASAASQLEIVSKEANASN